MLKLANRIRQTTRDDGTKAGNAWGGRGRSAARMVGVHRSDLRMTHCTLLTSHAGHELLDRQFNTTVERSRLVGGGDGGGDGMDGIGGGYVSGGEAL